MAVAIQGGAGLHAAQQAGHCAHIHPWAISILALVYRRLCTFRLSGRSFSPRIILNRYVKVHSTMGLPVGCRKQVVILCQLSTPLLLLFPGPQQLTEIFQEILHPHTRSGFGFFDRNGLPTRLTIFLFVSPSCITADGLFLYWPQMVPLIMVPLRYYQPITVFATFPDVYHIGHHSFFFWEREAQVRATAFEKPGKPWDT